MTTREIDFKLVQIDEQLKPLLAQRDKLKSDRRVLLSKSFIEANHITKDDVELSSGDNKPWFGQISQFVEWLKAQPAHKRFAEWNETIYFTTDLLAGKMPPDMPTSIDDL